MDGPQNPPEIPFYPAFSLERRNDGLNVFWFERGFSQVTYGPQPESGRNACVLIALLTASKIALKKNLKIVKMNELNPHLIQCFVEGILQGIHEYSQLKERNNISTSMNLTIPEAYKGLKGKVVNIHEWKSYLYAVKMEENLHNLILEGLHAWRHKSLARKHFLFIILIADSRAVLNVIDEIEDTISFFDSHPHASSHGACIASADLADIKPYCKWICKLFQDLYNSTPTCFELSYFQVKQR